MSRPYAKHWFPVVSARRSIRGNWWDSPFRYRSSDTKSRHSAVGQMLSLKGSGDDDRFAPHLGHSAFRGHCLKADIVYIAVRAVRPWLEAGPGRNWQSAITSAEAASSSHFGGPPAVAEIAEMDDWCLLGLEHHIDRGTRRRSVPMLVMKVWIVHMRMPHRLMAVPMRMRLRDRPVMDMLMVFVMNMAVLVLQRFVVMLVRVAFSEVEIKADCHQGARHKQPQG